MGILREIWFGTGPAQPVEFHDSTLESLILSTELSQSGIGVSDRWKVPAVYRGCQILSDLVGQLPWYAYDGGQHSRSNEVRPPKRRESIPTIMLKPDPFTERSDFLRQIVLSLIWHGDAFIRWTAVANGRPVSVECLDSAQMVVSQPPNSRRVEYYYQGQQIPAGRIDQLSLNKLPGRLRGCGPLDAGWETIRGQLAVERFAREFYSNDGIPSGKLTSPTKLTQDETQMLLESWQLGQGEGRKTAVLSGGLTYEPLSLSPDEAQMLGSRAMGTGEIARLLGIPAHLLNASTGIAGAGSSSSLTYTNVSMIFSELVRMTLAPVYLERIEDVASSWLPVGQSVIFDTSEFERADQGTRFDSYAIGISNGFLDISEVRAREGLDPTASLATGTPVPDQQTEVTK